MAGPTKGPEAPFFQMGNTLNERMMRGEPSELGSRACIHMSQQESWLATVQRPVPATWTLILRDAATEAAWAGGL